MDIFLSQNNNKKTPRNVTKIQICQIKERHQSLKYKTTFVLEFQSLNMQIILSNISQRKSFTMLTLKGFLFFFQGVFFILTDVIKSYCEKQFWKLLHLLTIDTQNINQIIVRIGFCSAAKIASTIKLIENDKRFILSRHTEGSPPVSNLCRYRPISIDA